MGKLRIMGGSWGQGSYCARGAGKKAPLCRGRLPATLTRLRRYRWEPVWTSTWASDLPPRTARRPPAQGPRGTGPRGSQAWRPRAIHHSTLLDDAGQVG